jgi:hypothetical protein
MINIADRSNIIHLSTVILGYNIILWFPVKGVTFPRYLITLTDIKQLILYLLSLFVLF